MHFSLAVLAGLLPLAFTLPFNTETNAQFKVFRAPELSAEWQLGAPEADARVRLSFALVEQNMDKLTAMALEISDPTSPSYSKYLTRAEIEALTAPPVSTVKAVEEWIRAHTTQIEIVQGGSFIRCNLDVPSANALLGTSFRRAVRSYSEGRQQALVAAEYALPVGVAGAIRAVFGVHDLPLPPTTPILTSSAVHPPVTPDVLAKTYGISGVNPTGSIQNRQAVAEFQGQYMSDADLVTFFAKYLGPDTNKSDATVFRSVGVSAGSHPAGIEAQLDIQYIKGVAPRIATDFYEQQSMAFCSDLVNWTSILLSDPTAPIVHSVSYGWQGNLAQVGCTDDLVNAVDANFVKLAAAGVSLIISSGDSGSGYVNSGVAGPLYPSWPASSPWVTAVGGTRFNNDSATAGEGAVNAEDHYGSGGGFSTQFPQPAWQASAVAGYFSTVDPASLPDPKKATYPKNGRATPDVAALGTAFQVINDGQPIPGGVGGTSASAPVFAAIVSLLNEARFAAGKKQLGFLNQWLYQNADAFYDVTVGSDKIGRGGGILTEGFNCAKGWDPVTGLGTPKFPLLLAAALKA